MNKLLAALLASATALALSCSVLAADKDPQSRDNQTQAQPNATKGKPGQSESQAGKDRMKDENSGTAQQDPRAGGTSDEAYSAELKKCNAMSGSQKKQCIDAAKKKAGQM